MPNLKKQIMDLKWILERSSEILNIDQLNKMQDVLHKAYDDEEGSMEGIDLFDKPEDVEDEEEQEEGYGKGTEESIDGDDKAAIFLKDHEREQAEANVDTEPEPEPEPEPEQEQEAPKAEPKRTVVPENKSKKQKQELHKIHDDEGYRNSLKDYANNYLQKEYVKIIRDAKASDNPDKATTGHAYHFGNPQHGSGLTKEIETLQNDPKFKELSPREQHMQMAQAQSDHFDSNPAHADDFVKSGRERNEYAKAAKLAVGKKKSEEEEDIAHGGATAIVENHMDANQAGEATGGTKTESGTQANIFTTAAQRAAAANPNAARSLRDSLAHNTKHDPENTSHGEREERLKGVVPRDILAETEAKTTAMREQSQKEALANQGGFKDTKHLPHEQLGKEYQPKIDAMEGKLRRSFGKSGSGVSEGDLTPHGRQGLWEAVRDFNPKNHNFKGLAYGRINARMTDEIKKRVNISKGTYNKIRNMEEAHGIVDEEMKTKIKDTE